MPEIVKYERIQTAETDLHASQDDDAVLVRKNGKSAPESLNEVQSQRMRFNVAQTTAATLALILLYFCLSIGLTFYQRWVLKEFPFPLFVVVCHLFIKLLISVIDRLAYRLFTGRSRVLVDWRTFVQKVSPTGLTSGIDIGFSNWGLELVTISLYTMTKSTTIIFILMFAILLGLERKSWSLMTIVVMISSGLFLFTYKSTEFNGLGFSFLLFASLVSGMRWTFAQLIMQRSKLGLHNPVDMVFHMQPWMIVSVLPFTIGFEGAALYDGWSQLDLVVPETRALVGQMAGRIVAGACIAFCMELSEFLVLSYTSSLTLAVSGIFKEICQLVLAVTLNGDRMSPMNVIGLVLCLGGICSHVLHKYRHMQKQAAGAQEVVIGETNKTDGGEDGGRMAKGGSAGGDARTPLWRSTNVNGSGQPLLDDGDSDDDEDDDGTGQRQSASDIIFDVLKRRDTRRTPL